MRAFLNCQCNALAKLALSKAFFREISPGYSLPHEHAFVLIGKHKVTSNVGPLLRFESGKSKARQFFAKKSILAGQHFHKVLWTHLHAALRKQSVAFRHCLTRHVSHFCGSLRMQHRVGLSDSSKCPCCGYLSESIYHQLHCSDPDRVQLFMDDCNLLIENLQHLGISSLLAQCIFCYLQGRGDIRMQDIPCLPEE